MKDGLVRPARAESWGDWVRRKRAPKTKGAPLHVVDFFCGCGGMTLGAQEGARRVGRKLTISLANDIDPAALGVYKRNFSLDDSVAVCADVRHFLDRVDGNTEDHSARLRQLRGRVDLFLAGPPCQGHSDLNNKSRRDDPRNRLYSAAIRAVEVMLPTVVIIENVPPVVHDKTGSVRSGASSLMAMGYALAEGVVSMAQLGLAQTRRRHVLLASRTHSVEMLNSVLSGPGRGPGALRDFISDLEDNACFDGDVCSRLGRPSKENARRIAWLFKHGEYDLPDQLRPPCHRDKSHSYRSMYGRLCWDRPAQTITSGFGSMGQGRYVHPSRPRTLTSHEAARIQGFPDFFDFGCVSSVSALRRMIGNAVPPQFCAHAVSQLFP